MVSIVLGTKRNVGSFLSLVYSHIANHADNMWAGKHQEKPFTLNITIKKQEMIVKRC